ncbi:hypothetical protein M5W68_00200 [Paenibacillus larvae]|uniref:hypothetical protein n=1 Tax=Paenibacillus larvae TaxID=1464 RepID=UPI00227F0BA4|nr:hypothetical protein [Paenibacillus larvae]MCY9512241.1 hypothetical protein [Paenibacillus larvae]MCY9523625.1 hypothetical protein [Paenibacillus larvae]
MGTFLAESLPCSGRLKRASSPYLNACPIGSAQWKISSLCEYTSQLLLLGGGTFSVLLSVNFSLLGHQGGRQVAKNENFFENFTQKIFHSSPLTAFAEKFEVSLNIEDVHITKEDD